MSAFASEPQSPALELYDDEYDALWMLAEDGVEAPFNEVEERGAAEIEEELARAT